MKKVLNTRDVITELSIITGYTKKDTRKFVKALQELIETCVEKDIEINLQGLFRLWYASYAERIGYNGLKKERMVLPKSYKIIISLSSSIKKRKKEKFKGGDL